MSQKLRAYRILNIVVLLGMLFSPLQSVALAASIPYAEPAPAAFRPPAKEPDVPEGTALFRTQVQLRNPADWTRLDKLGVVVLQPTEDQRRTTEAVPATAVVLVDEVQLEDLARLRFEPRATDELGALVVAHSRTKPWLVAGVRSFMEVVAAERAADQQKGADSSDAKSAVFRSSEALTPELKTALATLTSVDDDADGLTNTQEAWWCTDPLNADSDGDGATDGAEVQTAKDWLGNLRGSYSSTGKPFVGWPPDHAGCNDDDQDSVPDLAERWELGLNMNRESTDRDKFDDGQELFGNTYCPGSGGYCGYGALPRNEDWGIIFAEMPAWVKAPGNHPLVAAFPAPEIDVVESSLHVETVTVVTTDHTIGEGVERSYSTAKTEGTSTSVANTIMWNRWQEVARTTQAPSQLAFYSSDTTSSHTTLGEPITLGAIIGGAAVFVGTKCILDGAIEILAGEDRTTCERIYDNRHNIKESLIVGAKEAVGGIGYDPNADALQNLWGLSKCAVNMLRPPGTGSCLDKAVMTGSEAFYRHLRMRNAKNSLERGEPDAGGSGTHIEQNASYAVAYPKIEVNIPLPAQSFTPTNTKTQGTSWGGAQTTTTTEYEEHTVTNGEAFSSQESWGTATAVDSSHAADLWFTYKVRNTGSEYAREIADLAFNVYIGDDPNPAYTYFVANDVGGDGKFHNFMPGEAHPYTSARIPLTLEQMMATDLGGPVRIVVENFTYGIDELFYQDAVDAGVLVAIEDGTDDSDELIDTYLIPTWGEESVLDVLARYFPHETDADDNLIAVWMPEYRSDTPAWCSDPRWVGATLWCKYELSTADWWNVYLDGLGDGSKGFQDTPAAPGSVAFFRFNKDSDLDGYSDRSEIRLGTDPNNPASHPTPQLVAGLHSIRSGDHVTATLSLLNTGLYDAYGVEAVMIAPDDSVSITNNTVGGSGRVRALHQVVIGSRTMLQDPLPSEWTQSGHAAPVASGYYTGTEDRIYIFTVVCGVGSCDVGSGSWSLDWYDNTGNSGSLDFGDSYSSPTLLDVGTLGVKLALYSGTVYNNESFTVNALMPRDTFQYIINREPYAAPLVIVSYNDPQGSHRFVTPVSLSDPQDDLSPYSEQMARDFGAEIVTTEPFTAGQNTTNVVVNLPVDTAMVDAHVFMEFIDAEGTVAHEVPVTVTLQPGPTVVPAVWSTDVFSPTFQADQDYIAMAFWTDYEGNILDTTARPLSSFQEDPLPTVATNASAWDIGIVQQNDPVYREFVVGNTGKAMLPMLARTDSVSGTLMGDTVGVLPPGDSATLGLLADTSELGPITGTITINTSDMDTPQITIPISGTVAPAPNIRISDADITLIPDHPTLLQPVWVQADVHNDSAYAVEDVTVRSYLGDPLAGGTQMSSDQVIASIAPGGVGSASGRLLLAYFPGRDHVHVTVDPDDTIPEENEFDNDARAFLNVSSVLPPDGILTDGNVVLITDTAQLTSTIVVTDSAALVMKGITATIDSLLIGGDAVVVFDDTNLQIGQIDHSPTISSTLLAISNNSTITSTHPFTVTAQRIELLDSSLVSKGDDGNSLSGGTYHGTPGQPAGIALSGTYFLMRGGELASIGGKGGNGASWDPGGNGALGAKASVVISATASAEVLNSSIMVEGGYGGKGGYSNDLAGGYGAAGAEASLDLSSPTVIIQSSGISVQAGDGGGGGSSDGTSGRNAGSGAAALVTLSAESVVGQNTSILALGGNGGGGGDTVDVVSGHGGSGGDAQILLNVDSARWRNSNLESVAGNGGRGGTGISCNAHFGGNGGGGGNSTFTVSSTLLKGMPIKIVSKAGSGGTGGYGQRGGLGGIGGSATLAVTAGYASTDEEDFRVLAGDGGAGGTGCSIPGSGGDGGSMDLSWQITQTWHTQGIIWDTHIGAGGQHPNNPGAPGGQNIAVTDGYEAHSAGNELVSIGDLLPNLLALKGLDSLNVGWDGGTTDTVSPPYTTAIPSSPGLHTLDVHYVYTDTSTADSHHGFYVYRSFLDYDSDGLNDADEVNVYGTDPVLPDTDDDRLDDGDEIAARTDPLNPDSDYDGTPDGEDPDVLNRPDLTPDTVGPEFSNPSPIEGDVVTVSTTVSNTGSHDAEGVVVAFYATAPGWGETYVGSDFVPHIPAGGSAAASIEWNTLGFSGDVPVRMVADPFDRLLESDAENNDATANITILTRPDLHVPTIELSDPEPVAGQPVTVTLTISNVGQTSAGASTVALYDGSPESGGVLVSEGLSPVPGGSETTLEFIWTPTQPGPHRLFATTDRDDVVNEFDEGNNQTWNDVYVGFAGPLLLDSGGASDSAYSSAQGYGYIDEGQADVVANCGTERHQTYRRDPDGRIVYRFDHLLPGHFYHLDATLYECIATGRQESIYVDGNLVAGPKDLGDGEVHQLSILIDPALYTDNTIAVAIEDPGVDGAVVSEVNLHDIDYRYADAGGANDPTYATSYSYGWLDGTPNTAWGTLPSQSVRIDQSDNELRYRFDDLEPTKRYRLHFTFWQPSGYRRIQKVQVDGTDAGLTVDTGDYQAHRESVSVPESAYVDGDHDIVVSVIRMNAGTGALINEIALEEETIGVGNTCIVSETPYRMDVYGNVTIDAQPAPVGTVVQAISPRGDTVGCFVVSTAGQFGFMPVYGEDDTADPTIPGMRDGEVISFRVNGVQAIADPLVYWQDGAQQQTGLAAGGVEGQFILLGPGWNLVSFRVEPAVPPVDQALGNIDGQYDRVLGETGVYVPSLPDVYNTLHELHAGKGYYLRLTSSTSTNLLVEGMPATPDSPIDLHQGWNWIGYLPDSPMPVAEALQSIAGLFQRVLSLNKVYDPALPEFSTLTELQPGEGYLIYMDQAGTLTYPNGVAVQGSAGSQEQWHSRVSSSVCDDVQPTPFATLVYGAVLVNGEPAPAGTRVEVLTSDGNVAGCFVVEQPGEYGLMYVYGADTTADPPIPGFKAGEFLRFRVNGIDAAPRESWTWQDDKAPHRIDLAISIEWSHRLYLPLIQRGLR